MPLQVLHSNSTQEEIASLAIITSIFNDTLHVGVTHMPYPTLPLGGIYLCIPCCVSKHPDPVSVADRERQIVHL